MTTKSKHSEEQAAAQLESILEMVGALRTAEAGDDQDAREDVLQAINEDPLSLELRSDWYTLDSSAEDRKPAEFCLLLCTGGPACRIIGTLDEYSQPDRARIEHQDWGTPWIDYPLTQAQEDDVLTYCRCFYFGD
jgi:hypothetical protein